MNTNKELQLVTFEQAKRLKKLGFDWDCFYAYRLEDNEFGKAETLIVYMGDGKLSNDAKAPRVALALKWFRDEKKTVAHVSFHEEFSKVDGKYHCHYKGMMQKYNGNDSYKTPTSSKDFYTYEAAESALLDKLLTLLEKENNNQ